MDEAIQKTLLDRFTEEDHGLLARTVVETYFQTPLRPVDQKMATTLKQTLERLPKSFLKKLNIASYEPSDILKKLVYEGDEVFPSEQTIYSTLQSIHNDPLAAILFVQGEKVANLINTITKKYFFEELENLRGVKIGKDKRKTAFQRAFERLAPQLDDKTKVILFGKSNHGKVSRFVDAIERGFSKAEQQKYDLEMSIKSSGLIETQPDLGAMEARPSLEGFAREAAASEQGPQGTEAQSKNPRPRKGRTPPKKHKPGGP